MADWSKPALASTYANFVNETNARDTDLAVGFDPAVVTPTNIPTNTIRWRDAANKWEKWNGTTWSDLAATYAINISGTAANVTGTVAASKGGTGQTSYTIGDLLYASGAAALSKLAAVATGNVLLSGGAATAPTWGKVGLATHVSGTLPVANGGTGTATLTGVAYGNGTGAMTAATAAQLVAAIGTTAVASATTAANGGVTSVNGQTGAVTVTGVPAGAVMHFAMATPPTGWLEANGALVSRSTYASLFAAIGTIFGVGDGSTTFNLPDLRGEFVRGHDNGRGVDSGRVFGSYQAYGLQSHTHTYVEPVLSAYPLSHDSSLEADRSVTTTTGTSSATGGTETRPRNVALLACIKF